ncbi:MAG: indolepyruvate oxidoreductase subunit beta [Armatimonadetes bacterium]|nr:indolepyruvate oxidoreductase subunit beta [Armatimonadota bacterium]
MRTIQTVIVGMGGQGVLKVAEVVANTAFAAGLDVKMSEVHGMAQRGGSVSSFVSTGERVYSPLIARGRADIVLGLEVCETARWLPYLHPEGVLAVAEWEVPIAQGGASWLRRLHTIRPGLKVVSRKVLKEAGVRYANLSVLGAASPYWDFSDDEWLEGIERTFPLVHRDPNWKAFCLGRNVK